MRLRKVTAIIQGCVLFGLEFLMSISGIQSNINSQIISNFGPSARQNNDFNSSFIGQSLENKTKPFSKEELLADVASQQIGMSKQILSSSLSGGDPLTEQLVGLTTYSKNQQKTDALPEGLKNVVGNIINELV